MTMITLRKFAAAALLVMFTGCGDSARETCRIHQGMIWDAAGSHYLERGMKPEDLIDPQLLKPYFAQGQLPRCPLSTNDYAPFKYFDGPRCPYDPTKHPPTPATKKVERIRRNMKSK